MRQLGDGARSGLYKRKRNNLPPLSPNTNYCVWSWKWCFCWKNINIL